jgi:bile acid:Na+ symporter, BASS family
MKAAIDLGILIINLLIMITVGISLRGSHFRVLQGQKRALIPALGAQFLFLPLLAFVLTRALALPAHISAGILLVAACPVGDVANFYTLLARGEAALSVTTTALTCLLSALTMALVFEGYDHLLGAHFVFAVPSATIVIRLVLMVVVPVLAGMALRRFRPEFSRRRGNDLRNASIVGLGLLLAYVIGSRWQQIAADWQQTALAGALFVLLALLIGLVLGWLVRLDAAGVMTMGLMFATRNVALATVIAVALLNKVEYAGFAVVYFLTEVPLLLAAIVVYRRRDSTGAGFTTRAGTQKL